MTPFTGLSGLLWRRTLRYSFSYAYILETLALFLTANRPADIVVASFPTNSLLINELATDVATLHGFGPHTC